MWEVLVGHMEQMLKHMESVGPGAMAPGMMHGTGGPSGLAPPEKKPQWT